MTAAQLREILKSNLLTIATPETSDPTQLEDYIEAGAHILLAPACQRMDDEEADVLAALVEAASDRAFVAGQLRQPTELPHDEASYDSYYHLVMRQAEWLEDMGASLLFLTDFSDILTAKCAVYAIREALGPDMPICVGLRVTHDATAVKRALSLLVALQALEVCSVGCTGMDIEDSLYILSELQAFTTVPLFSIAEPGHYLTPEDYSDYISSFVHQKCAMTGLNHSSAAYVAAAVKGGWQHAPIRPDFPLVNAICSRDEALFFDFGGKTISRNQAQIEIKTEEEAELKQALALFNRPGAVPVCFAIRDIELLEYAILHYAGRPAVRTDEYGEITAKELGALILPVAENKTDNAATVE